MKSRGMFRHESVVFGSRGLSAIETARRAEAALRRADLHEEASHSISTLPSKEIEFLELDNVPEEYLGKIIDKTNGVVYAHYIVASKDFGEDTITLRSGTLVRVNKETDVGVKHLTGKEGYIELKQHGDMRAIGVRIATEGPSGMPLYAFKKYVTHSRVATLIIDRDKPIDRARLMHVGSSAVSDGVSSMHEYISASGGASAAAASTVSAGPALAAADISRDRRMPSFSATLRTHVDSLIKESWDIERLHEEGMSYFKHKFENRIDGKSILATIENIHAHPAISSFESSSRTRLLKLTSILFEYYEADYLRAFLINIYDSFEIKPSLTGSVRQWIKDREQALERHTIAQASALRALTEIREFDTSESIARRGIFSECNQRWELLVQEMSLSLAEARSVQLQAQLNRLKDGARIEVARDELQLLLQEAGVHVQESTGLAKLSSNPTSAFYKALRDQETSVRDGIIYGGSNNQFFELHFVSIFRDIMMHNYLLNSMVLLGLHHYYDTKDIRAFLNYNIFNYLYSILNFWFLLRIPMLFPYHDNGLHKLAVWYNMMVFLSLQMLIYFKSAISSVIEFMLPFISHIVYEIGLQKYLGHQIDFAVHARRSALHALRVIAPLFLHEIALKVVPTYSHNPGVPSFFAYIILPIIVGVISYKLMFVPAALSLGFLFGACIMRATSKHTCKHTSSGTPVKSKTELDQVKPLSLAIEAGNKHTISSLISSGVDIHYEDANGDTPLMSAIKKRDLWMVRQFLDAGVNVNQENKSGVTALILAAQSGYENVVGKLLKHGANVNHATQDGITALMLAVKHRHALVVKRLLLSNANLQMRSKIGATSLSFMSENVSQLIWRYIATNATVHWHLELMLAAQDKDEATLDILLRSAVNLEEEDALGNTLLSMAARDTYDSLVVKLIAANADINHANKYGATPLMIACQNGRVTTANLLIRAGVKLDQANNDGDIPLIVSARQNHALMVNHLLNSGTAINTRNNIGNTAIIESAGKGYDSILDQLINAGADVKIVNSVGDTALMVSAHHASSSTVERLINAGSEINHANDNGLTALRFASCFNPMGLGAAWVLLKAKAILDDHSLACLQSRGVEFTNMVGVSEQIQNEIMA